MNEQLLKALKTVYELSKGNWDFFVDKVPEEAKDNFVIGMKGSLMALIPSELSKVFDVVITKEIFEANLVKPVEKRTDEFKWFNYKTQQVISSNLPLHKEILLKHDSTSNWEHVVLIGRTLNGKYIYQYLKNSGKDSGVQFTSDSTIFRPLDWDKYLTTSKVKNLLDLMVEDLNNVMDEIEHVPDAESDEQAEENMQVFAKLLLAKGWKKPME